jgi:hypothetical protein
MAVNNRLHHPAASVSGEDFAVSVGKEMVSSSVIFFTPMKEKY